MLHSSLDIWFSFNFPAVKEFWKSIKIWWSYHQESGDSILLEHSVICGKFKLLTFEVTEQRALCGVKMSFTGNLTDSQH